MVEEESQQLKQHSRKHVIYFHKMISSPIFFIGMVLLGAVFCVKPLGRHGTGKRLFIAIIIGMSLAVMLVLIGVPAGGGVLA